MSHLDLKDNTRRIQYELFFSIPDFSEISLRDNQETMQRPFFSLSKSKRLKPIDYVSPDKSCTVHVSGNPEFGIATIWDADIMIYLASHLNQMKAEGHNDLPQSVRVHPGNLLKRIQWGTSGRAYERLVSALDRLQTTTIKTNIRTGSKSRETTFSWIDSYTHLVCEETQRSLGMEITLSKWFFDGVLDNSNILSISPEYFNITSGLAKWLYRVARKHAGGNGAEGFILNFDTLYSKSGVESPFPKFRSRVLAIIQENSLPEVALELVSNAQGKDQLKVTMRKYLAADQPKKEASKKSKSTKRDYSQAIKAQIDRSTKSAVERRKTHRLQPQKDASEAVGNPEFLFDAPLSTPQNQVSANEMRGLIEMLSSNLTDGVGSKRPSISDPHNPAYGTVAQAMPSHPSGHAQSVLDEEVYNTILSDCPGWDIEVMLQQFDTFLDVNPEELPRNYSVRFLGFMRSHHQRNKHTL